MTGTNPAGNTTTVEVLEGFRGCSAGRVSVLDADPAHAPGGYKVMNEREAIKVLIEL